MVKRVPQVLPGVHAYFPICPDLAAVAGVAAPGWVAYSYAQEAHPNKSFYLRSKTQYRSPYRDCRSAQHTARHRVPRSWYAELPSTLHYCDKQTILPASCHPHKTPAHPGLCHDLHTVHDTVSRFHRIVERRHRPSCVPCPDYPSKCENGAHLSSNTIQ